MNSREKGARGEREFADFLSLNGHPARRGCQYKGGENSPDVICESLQDFHFEVKRTEALRLYSSLAQAERDAGAERCPVVAHRKNEKNWVCIVNAEAWLALVDKAQKFDSLKDA